MLTRHRSAAAMMLAVGVVMAPSCTSVAGKPQAPIGAVAPTVSATEAAARDTKRSIQNKLDSDPDLAKLNLQVLDVVLINKSGNDYKGIATVKTPIGKQHDVAVDVTADTNNLIWETAPGAFLFALQEQLPAAAPPPAAVPRPSPNTLPSDDGMVYIRTKSGKTWCQLSNSEVDCQSEFDFRTPMANGCRANAVKFFPSGALQWICGDLGDIPVVSIGYATYQAFSWTIDATFDGTTFTHQGTGRSVFVSIGAVRVN